MGLWNSSFLKNLMVSLVVIQLCDGVKGCLWYLCNWMNLVNYLSRQIKGRRCLTSAVFIFWCNMPRLLKVSWIYLFKTHTNKQITMINSSKDRCEHWGGDPLYIQKTYLQTKQTNKQRNHLDKQQQGQRWTLRGWSSSHAKDIHTNKKWTNHHDKQQQGQVRRVRGGGHPFHIQNFFKTFSLVI